jgi:hypothetical protein
MNGALKWKLIAGFVLVFVAGGVTGGFVAAATIHHYFLESHHSIAAERMRERLKAQLDLTPEQVTKISPVIDKTAAQLEDIRRDTTRRVHEAFAECHRQISGDLNPQQRAKLDQMRRQHHRMLRRFHHKPGDSADSPSPDS